MHRTVSLLRNLALPLLLAFSLSACAIGRSAVDIAPPASTTTDSKAFAKIVEVDDLRVFEASPPDAGTPSLENANDITDKAITSRAIARKRNGYGMALGDVVLPEGKTVAGLVRGAAQKALQDKGYAVVEEGSPHYAAAQPLNIEIIQFWSWAAPGFFAVQLDFKSTLKLSGGTLLGADPSMVSSHLHDQSAAVFESVWVDLTQRGLNDTSDKIKEAIKTPPGS